MKRVLKIVGIGFGLLIIVSIILGVIADKHDGPRQSIKFLNTSDLNKSVTFEMIEKDGTLSDTWFVNEIIQPHSSLIKRIPEGNYKIEVWDEKDKLYKETEHLFELENKDESNYELYRFDLAMNKTFSVVYLNALYGGNDLAETMSKAVGTQSNQLRIEKNFKGDIPFYLSEQYSGRTFVDIDDDIPSTVKFGEVVYGLFYLPDTLTDAQFSDLLYEKINAKVE